MITSPASYTRLTGPLAETLVTSKRCALLAILPDAATAGIVTTRDGQAADGTGVVTSASAVGLPQAGKVFGPFGIQQGGLTVTVPGADVITVVWMPLP